MSYCRFQHQDVAFYGRIESVVGQPPLPALWWNLRDCWPNSTRPNAANFR